MRTSTSRCGGSTWTAQPTAAVWARASARGVRWPDGWALHSARSLCAPGQRILWGQTTLLGCNSGVNRSLKTRSVQWKSMFDGTRLWRGIASTGRVAPPSKCPRAPEEVSPFPHALLGQEALHPSLSSTPIMHLCVRPYLYVCVFVCVLVVPLIVMFLRAPRAATGPAAPAQCARRYLSLECEPCLYRKAPFASPQVCPAVWLPRFRECAVAPAPHPRANVPGATSR